MGRFKLPLSAAVLFAFAGCAQMCGVKRSEMNPTQVVEAYLTTSFNMTSVSERETLLDFTIGPLKDAVASVSDDTIRAAYIDRRFKLLSYAVVEQRDRTPREAEVTFELRYQDISGVKKGAPEADTAVTSTENTVTVKREKNRWSIYDVIGKKTTIDFALAESTPITARPGELTEEPPTIDIHGDIYSGEDEPTTQE